jgi:adenylate cyclase
MLSSNLQGHPVNSAQRNAAIVGIAAGAVGVLASLLPPVLALEESLGLNILYSLRGTATPPPDVIIVAIDSDSADALDLAEELRSEVGLTGWPRRLHADLIAAVDAAGASVIAFDIHFREPQDRQNDASFAAAIRSAGNVILFDSMERDLELPDDTGTGQGFQIFTDHIVHPLPEFADAALATAPFPLPTVPFRTNQYWAFLPSANDVPTLPVVAFGVRMEAAQEQIERLANESMPARNSQFSNRDTARRMLDLRHSLQRNPELAAALQSELLNPGRGGQSSDMRSLLNLYTGPDSRYLNFYGPPQTIMTVPVHEILTDGPDPDIPWNGSMVLVGYSDRTQPKQNDTFLSFYSQRSGLDVSGVEIAATALANLIQGRTLTAVPLTLHLAAVLLLGLLFGACFLLRSVAAPVLTLLLVLAGFIAAAQLQFTHASVWWPLVVPGFLQAPLALLLGLSLSYSRAEDRHAAISRGASRYLPAELVARIAENPEAATRSSELVNGICMVTDIENFTAYAEGLPPKQLETALNAYYDTLFRLVDNNGGLVTDIVGDSMVAVWPEAFTTVGESSGPIEAALGIRDFLTQRNTAFPRTRVGLGDGDFVLGTIGARDHLEYRAVGDTINSTARIQALNKRLGTTVLSTRDALRAADVSFREIGTFQLAGKQNLLEICEPVCIGTSPSEREIELIERFAAALADFRQGQLQQAALTFEKLRVAFPDDGPARFYVGHIKTLLHSGTPSSPDPVVRLVD